jgi:hypothetical protein
VTSSSECGSESSGTMNAGNGLGFAGCGTVRSPRMTLLHGMSS